MVDMVHVWVGEVLFFLVMMTVASLTSSTRSFLPHTIRTFSVVSYSTVRLLGRSLRTSWIASVIRTCC